MTSIPVAICRFSDNNFKGLYVKKERLFIDFWLYSWNVHEIYNVEKKKVLPYYSELLHPKEMFS